MVQSLTKEIPRFDILGVKVSAMNMDEALTALSYLIQTKQKGYVCVCPVSTIMACQENSEVKAVVNKAYLVTPDGMPTVWIGRQKGFKNMTRVYGPDLMREMCALSDAQGFSHYFYGATEETLQKLTQNLKQQFPHINIRGHFAPPFGEFSEIQKKQIIEDINSKNPDILWVGLGSPKQDIWMAQHRVVLNVPVMVGVGAAFDFLSGSKKQAPRWVQNVGLEWFFRFCSEPQRLWRRYLIGNTKFVYLLVKEWMIFKVKGNLST